MPWKYKDNEPRWCPDHSGIYHFVFDVDTSGEFDLNSCICGLISLKDYSTPETSPFPETTHCPTCCSLLSAFESFLIALKASINESLG